MTKQWMLTLMIVSFVLSEGQAQTLQEFFSKTDIFLKTHVSEGRVNYKAIHSNPQALNDLMQMASNISVTATEENTIQAFWINAYNISVIKGIIDNYPIQSPLDKKGFFDKTKFELGGIKITLNDIENKKLRSKFGDARFHFVLVCGAKGCPPLIGEAFTAFNLEELLEQQTIKALNSSSFIVVSDGKVAFSEIFKWYKDDFVKGGQTEIDFLNKYRKDSVPKDSKITYYPYDWRLNSK